MEGMMGEPWLITESDNSKSCGALFAYWSKNKQCYQTIPAYYGILVDLVGAKKEPRFSVKV